MKLDNDFYKPEIIDGTYVSEELKKIWAVNLDLLENFNKYCDKYKLRFFIGFGTLLGALRHQGFVPWDDDVDIIMPRDDFEQLKKLGTNFSYPYFLQSDISEKEFWYGGMMKFRRSDTTFLEYKLYKNRHINQGIALEIMPLDYIPDDSRKQRKQAEKIGRLQRLIWAKIHDDELHKLRGGTEDISNDEWKKLKNEALKYKLGDLKSELLNVSRRYNNQDTKRLGIYLFYNKEDVYRIFERAWFKDKIMMDFVNLRLPAPKGFWELLEALYGKGFINGVPSKERKPHHFAVWDTSTAYDVWQKRILDLYKDEGRKVIVFGTGNMARIFIEELQERLVIYACVDNDEKKQGTIFLGYKVYSPEILRNTPNQWHVIIANGYYREIGKQLENMGLNDYYVYVDEWQALFRLPPMGAVKSIQSNVKKYRILGIIIDDDLFGLRLLNWIKDRCKECEYLIAFVPKSKKEIVVFLNELKAVNRVVVTDMAMDELFNAYCCDDIMSWS